MRVDWWSERPLVAGLAVTLALTAGLIRLDDLYREVTIWQELTDQHKNAYSNLTDREIQNLNIRQLITIQIDQVILETEKRLNINDIKNFIAIGSSLDKELKLWKKVRLLKEQK